MVKHAETGIICFSRGNFCLHQDKVTTGWDCHRELSWSAAIWPAIRFSRFSKCWHYVSAALLCRVIYSPDTSIHCCTW